MTGDIHPEDDNDREFDPAREIENILKGMFSGDAASAFQFDPSDLAKAAGLPIDENALQQMLGALRSAMTSGSADGEIDWSLARKTAIEVASKEPSSSHASLQTAFSTASLWLDQATTMGSSADSPREINRIEWVQQSIDTWIELAAPVAASISNALTGALNEKLPEEFQSVLGQAAGILKGIGGAMFAMQLGQIVGKLATEVMSGGEIGIPLFSGSGREGGSLIPDNLAQFVEGLPQEEQEVHLFVAARELAHSRLFRHAKWLRSHLLSAIHEYASGIDIDMDHIEDLALEISPENPEQLHEILRSGQLIPPKTPRQEAAHERIELLIALIDGYVDVVTRDATKLLPSGTALAEMIRRRRAAGGPAERAFSTLIGLELRPRKLREAAAMWERLGDEGGIEQRDAVWAHPDFLPTLEEVENPELLLKRLGIITSEAHTEAQTFDEELRKFLEGTTGDNHAGETTDESPES